MEDKENQFASFNVKEIKNIDGPFQKKLFTKHDATRYKVKFEENNMTEQIHNDVNKDNYLMNQENYHNLAIPRNLFQHCKSITIQQTLNYKKNNSSFSPKFMSHSIFMDSEEQNIIQPQINHNNSLSDIEQTNLKSSNKTSFFTNKEDEEIYYQPQFKQCYQDWPTYDKTSIQYEQYLYVSIQGLDLANIQNTIQQQAEEIVALRKQQQQQKFNTSHLQSRIMEEKKFTSVQQINRNISYSSQRDPNVFNQGITQRLRKP